MLSKLDVRYDSVLFTPDLGKICDWYHTVLARERTFHARVVCINKIPLPTDMLRLIQSYLQPTETVDTALECIKGYVLQLRGLVKEDIFDLQWYDYGTRDYTWAETRLVHVRQYLQQLSVIHIDL